MAKRGMKRPYLKKYGEVSRFVIWIVDGNYIRKNINEEFTNFGQHYRFRFIPKNEFWIDRDYSKYREEEFYIDHLLVEHRLMAEGKSYPEAIEKADAVERNERRKSELFRKVMRAGRKGWLRSIRLKLLKKYSNNAKVWIVDGALVRDLFYIDFTEGGHDFVYSFVPKGEVWIDDSIGLRERRFVILHELHERNMMASKNLQYSVAHRSASRLEYHCRHHPRELEKKLAEEAGKVLVFRESFK